MLKGLIKKNCKGVFMKKKLVLSAMLVCLLALGLSLSGCPTDGGDDDGGGKLPANLQNTKWEDDGDILEFKTDQIVLVQSNNTRTRTFNVVNAVENGQIMAAEVYGDYTDDPEEFCSSYTVAETTLDLKGERSFSGTYTKQP
jgi:hypothetical protein